VVIAYVYKPHPPPLNRGGTLDVYTSNFLSPVKGRDREGFVKHKKRPRGLIDEI
jgi:hypothetical protein